MKKASFKGAFWGKIRIIGTFLMIHKKYYKTNFIYQD